MGNVQEISERLFSVFQEGLSPSGDQHRLGRKPSIKALEPIAEAGLARFYAEAARERKKHRPGIIARARIAFHLQKKMVAAGYPLPVVRQVLIAMILSAFISRLP